MIAERCEGVLSGVTSLPSRIHSSTRPHGMRVLWTPSAFACSPTSLDLILGHQEYDVFAQFDVGELPCRDAIGAALQIDRRGLVVSTADQGAEQGK